MTIAEQLRAHGIQPSAQRLAIAEYVLGTVDHPTADDVWKRVSAVLPMVSRATVYNTLNLFVAKGLVRQLVIREGRVLFDPNVRPHHHFVDDETGEVRDVPLESVAVTVHEAPSGAEVTGVEVIVRGRSTR